MRSSSRYFLVLSLSVLPHVVAQTDPGVRQGPPGAGQPIAGLTANELAAFQGQVTSRFVSAPSAPFGVGPRFNGTGCAGCHAFPAPGGSSPTVNPQVTMATLLGATNTLPSFITATGPVTEVRFIKNLSASGQPTDGGVHNLFTITGRTDAPAGCVLKQEDFSNTQNLSFRIATPTFGLGLIEAITDTTLKNNLASNGLLKAIAQTGGHFNNSGNDGTITRFGWKAQNKSLLMFSGEAYNVEMGVTSELFTQNRDETPACIVKGSPEDFTNLETNTMSHIESFTLFMKFLDQPQPSCGGTGQAACSSSITNGKNLFNLIGCALCHTPTLQSGTSTTAALNNIPVNLYSDLAVHYMGQAFEDDVVQGSAQSGEFRTAPLWGLGQRVFFFHDGRTSDLQAAILAHSGDPKDSQKMNWKQLPNWPKPGGFQGQPQAGLITQIYTHLPASNQQDILNFLRSL